MEDVYIRSLLYGGHTKGFVSNQSTSGRSSCGTNQQNEQKGITSKGGLLNQVQKELGDETAQLITAVYNLFLKTT